MARLEPDLGLQLESALGGWKLALAFLFVIAYVAYSTEMSATFAPEFHDTNRDTAKSLISSGIFCLVVFTLLPIGLVGAVGTKGATADPIGFYAPAFAHILGGASAIMIAAFVLSMAGSTADPSRALYGIAGDGMTVRQLHHLNRHDVPGRAMAVDLFVNLLLVFTIGDVLGILLAANLGYVSCHVLALSGFLLLRRDRPSWPRPIRVGPIAVGASVALVFFNLVLIGVGVSSPSLTGYGGTKDVVIGVAILVGSVVLPLGVGFAE